MYFFFVQTLEKYVIIGGPENKAWKRHGFFGLNALPFCTLDFEIRKSAV